MAIDWDGLPRLLQELCDGHPGYSLALYAYDTTGTAGDPYRLWLCQSCWIKRKLDDQRPASAPVSRRTAATIQRGKPHLFVEDPDTPDCCVTCKRIRANDMHIDELPATPPAVRTEEARRLGEREGDE